MSHVLALLGCAVVIYLACEWFVNAIEWLGERLQVGSMAVGSILAAVGTALPESVVTLVAVLVAGGGLGGAGGSAPGGPASGGLAIGAAMGGPLVVGTVADAVTGAMLLLRQRARVAVRTGAGGSQDVDPLDGTDLVRMGRDQAWFLTIFVVKVGLGLVAFAVKPWLGLLFFAAYAVYFRRELSSPGDPDEVVDLEPLRLTPRAGRPATWAVVTQTVATVVLIFVASRLFVDQLAWAGPVMGLSTSVVALLLSPVATELPEVLNAVIWVRQGKTSLALANISGAMMIQATVPSGIGLLGTPWRFDTPLLLSGLATLASVVYLLALFRTGRVSAGRLVMAGGFYLAFAAALAAAGAL